MHVSNIKLWNFRRFGCKSQGAKVNDLDLKKPALDINFTHGLNVLIGENDSGKTAIIDAVKLVLKTHSNDWIRVEDDDFFTGADRFRIELQLISLADHEAKNFIEWLGWTGDKTNPQPYLRLIYDVSRNAERILPSEVKAGVDDVGYPLSAEAREYLKVTYLKPLRDAKNELVPGRNSRLSQIFQNHSAFRGKDKEHYLAKLFSDFNQAIDKYFQGQDREGKAISDISGKGLKTAIDSYVQRFSSLDRETDIGVVHEGSLLKPILEKLGLFMSKENNPGLGTLNRLFMASELIHLESQPSGGLQLGLIEELEAHLHPQAQMQVIEALQQQDEIQLILTTHSPNLASKVKLENLIICNQNNAYPVGHGYTLLDDLNDYKFLELFLDVTKANLFFAKGVIMVEGWAEECLIPVLARKLKQQGVIRRNLTEAGVSIVNVGTLAFLRYSRIFVRKDKTNIGIPVAIVTDVDIRTYDKIPKKDIHGNTEKDEKGKIIYDYPKCDQFDVDAESIAKRDKLKAKYEIDSLGGIKAAIAPEWTLEYCLLKSGSLGKVFKSILEKVHPQIDGSNLEQALAEKLINKGLDKTEIAYKLAQILAEDCANPSPKIVIDIGDRHLSYLIEAIKHVCN